MKKNKCKIKKGTICIVSKNSQIYEATNKISFLPFSKRQKTIKAGEFVFLCSLKAKNNLFKVLFEGKMFYINKKNIFPIVGENSFIKNKNFSLTGELHFSRIFYKKIINFYGGTCSRGISKKSDYLIIPSGKLPITKKIQKSTKYKIEHLKESSFLKKTKLDNFVFSDNMEDVTSLFVR